MIYFLDNSLQLQKIVTSKNIISAIHEHELNGLIRADVELDLSYAKKFLILGIDHVGYYYKDEFYLHKIQRVEYDHVNESVKVVLRHIFFEDMIFGKLIQDVRPQNQDALAISRQTIDANTRWQTVMTDVTGHLSTNFYWQVPYEVIEFMTENYRIDYLPKIFFDGEKINGFQLHLANQIGEDKNIRIPYGSRVLDLKYEEDYSEIITKLAVHGKGEEVGNGYGRRIDISDVNFSRNGVKSPVGSLYLEDESITNTYGNDDQTPREGREIFEDIDDPNKLAEAGYQHYLQVSRPQMLFTADVTDIGDVGIGDSVMIIRREYDVYFNARIHKLSVDLLYPEDAQVELGDYKHFKESKVARKTREKNNRVQGQLSDRITRLKQEANDRFDNEVKQWFEEYEQALIDAEAAVEAMRVTMTEEFETAQREFEEEFNQSVADAKQHADDVADAKAKEVQDNLDSFAGHHEQLVEELQGNIIDIDGELEEARSDVSEIVGRLTVVDGNISGITDSLTEIEGTLTNTRTELENKIDETEQALNEVEEDLGNAKTDLQNQLDAARAELEGLEIGGRNLIAHSLSSTRYLEYDDTTSHFEENEWSHTDYIPVEENEKFIISGYTNLGNNPATVFYDSDKEYISGLTRRGNNPKFTAPVNAKYMRFSYRNDEVGSIKLERGTVATDWTPAPEDTDNKITNINQTITNIEGELSTKVERTEVDTLKGTVTAQGTLLTQTANEVSSKAEKSVVDTLTGRVTNTESSVTQNAEEIAKRLTKSVYDEDKNVTDAKITQWTNTATETAEGLERVIGRVSQTENGVETAQTRIEAEAGRIDGVLSRTSKVEGQVRDAELAIEANADGLALRATKTEVEQAIHGIEVGGRNLLLDSNIQYETISYNIADYPLSEAIQEGTKVTISLKGELNTEKAYFGIYNSGGSIQVASLRRTSQKSNGVYVLTFNWKVGNVSNTFLRIYQMPSSVSGVKSSIDWVKLEYGNKATDWTPAPEDIDASISEVTDRVTTAEAELVVQAGEISQRATQSELDRVTGRVSTAESQLSVQAGQIALRATKTELEGIDGRVSATEASLTVMDDEISSVVGRVSDNETDISSVVQDVGSITSTVATLEGDVATQGSQIKQVNDAISSKVWMGDIQNINPNLIPFADTSDKDNLNYWTGYGNVTNKHINDAGQFNVNSAGTDSHIGIQSSEFELVQGRTYTFSVIVQTSEAWNTQNWFNYTFLMRKSGNNTQLGSANRSEPISETTMRKQWTFTATRTEDVYILLATPRRDSSKSAGFGFREPKLEEGTERTLFMNAFSNIEQLANKIALQVQSIDGDYLSQSDVEIRPEYVQIGSQRIGGETIGSVLRVSPTGIDMVAEAMRLSGDLYVDGDITTLAVNAIEGNFSRLFASSLTTNVIKSTHIQTDTALAKKLFAANANIDELITRTHFVSKMHALTLDVVDLNAASIRSKIITSNTIESDMLKVDLAMVSRFYTHTAFINNASIKAANITDLTATHIRGGLLESLNGSYSQNMITGNTHYYTNANINFHSQYNQLKMTNGTRIGGIYMRDEGLEKVKAHFGVSDGNFIDENSTSWTGMIADGETRSTLLSGNYIVFSANGYTRRYENASWRMDTASRGDGTNRYFYGNDSSKYNYILGHMNNKLSNIFTQYLGTSSDPVERVTTNHVNALRFTTINGYPAIIWGATGIQFRSNDGVYLISSSGAYLGQI